MVFTSAAASSSPPGCQHKLSLLLLAVLKCNTDGDDADDNDLCIHNYPSGMCPYLHYSSSSHSSPCDGISADDSGRTTPTPRARWCLFVWVNHRLTLAQLALALLTRVTNRMQMRLPLRGWFLQGGGVQSRQAEMMRLRCTQRRDHTRQTRYVLYTPS